MWGRGEGGRKGGRGGDDSKKIKLLHSLIFFFEKKKETTKRANCIPRFFQMKKIERERERGRGLKCSSQGRRVGAVKCAFLNIL